MAGFVVVMWLTAIACADADRGIIPNRLTLPALVTVAVAAVGTPEVGAAAATAAVPYLLAHVLGRCGGGDVKLAVVCGALAVRVEAALLMVLCAAVGTALWLLITRRESMRHGPLLVGACLLVAGPI